MIQTNMESVVLQRIPTTRNAYGEQVDSPETIATIQTSISLYTQAQDTASPIFTDVKYVGLTTYKTVRVGDLLVASNKTYIVREVGDPRARYLLLYLKDYE